MALKKPKRYQLSDYTSDVNRIVPEDGLAVFHCTFQSSDEEDECFLDLVETVLVPMSKLPWRDRKGLTKQLKLWSEESWECYMKNGSIPDNPLKEMISLIDRSSRSDVMKQNMIHTICRMGEYFFLSDSEMNSVSLDMDTFIEAGDCKLFDYENCPYGDIELTGDFEKDIFRAETNIRSYCSKESLPFISAETILNNLRKLKKWVDQGTWDDIPVEARGVIQVIRQIRKNIRRECRNPGTFLGSKGKKFEDRDLIAKLSGFCLNKEDRFKHFCFRANLPAWKNPEGSFFYGNTHYRGDTEIFSNMMNISWWDMDCIYYSVGKGPYDKCRYVGQPPAFFQNVAEPAARCVKKSILQIADRFKSGEEGIYDPSAVNIYDNYDSLLSLIYKSVDFLAMDYSSYSDYLNRDLYDWIMKNLFGFPDWYREIIDDIMAFPIKVNGRVYFHKHASVMGIKFNFLLITFSNWVMWVLGCMVNGQWDLSKFMGDDRIQGRKYDYTTTEVGIHYTCAAYANCIVNSSKSEVMSKDGTTSFCKRSFNKNLEQISGLSGEYLFKQKPFLGDVSAWLTLCEKNQIPVSERQREEWIDYWSEYYAITYWKFYSPEDPLMNKMISLLYKIPYQYGGWSLTAPNDTMEKVMFQSVLYLVVKIFEDMSKELESLGRKRIRHWIKVNSTKDLQYYNFLSGVTSYSQDYDRIQDDVTKITDILSSNIINGDKIREGRRAVQAIMEIILQRDSRLANSVSTKNRISFTFDQDRVTKLRATYLHKAISKEYSEGIRECYLDLPILKDSTEKFGMVDGTAEYMKYLSLKTRTGSELGMYWNAAENSWMGMKVERRNPDGKVVEFWKRLESADSSYGRIHRRKDGSWGGIFVNYEDLTEGERQMYKYLQGPHMRDFIRGINQAMNAEIESNIDIVLSELVEALE